MKGSIAVPGTSLELSRLGLGCARLFAGPELRASSRLVEAALAADWRHFDTAPSYAYGQSEAVLGAVLQGVREVTITTKVGIEAEGAPSVAGTLYRCFARPVFGRLPSLKRALLERAPRDAAPSPLAPIPRRLTRDAVRQSVERSLTRLRRDRIDVLLLHEPDQFIIDDELRAAFDELVSDGIVGAYGLGYGSAIEAAPDFGRVLQSRYHARYTPNYLSARLFHGALRYGEDQEPARTRLARAMAAALKAAFLVSVTSARQIDDLMSVEPTRHR